MNKNLINEIYNLKQELDDYKFYVDVIRKEVKSKYGNNKAKVESVRIHLQYLDERLGDKKAKDEWYKGDE